MKTIYWNKRIEYDYDIIKRYALGIVLFGWEVKQLKNGRFDMSSSYIKFEAKKPILKNLSIVQPDDLGLIPKSYQGRDKIILLRKDEIWRILQELKKNKTTFVPYKIFLNDRNLIKIEAAIAKGKKKYDKRALERFRDISKDLTNNY